jgi:hypothetical protein
MKLNLLKKLEGVYISGLMYIWALTVEPRARSERRKAIMNVQSYGKE